MGNRDHDVPAGNPGQLAQSCPRVGQVLEHFQAEDQVELVIGEGKFQQVGDAETGGRQPLAGEPDRFGVEVDADRALGKHPGQTVQGLAFAAAGIEHRAGFERGYGLLDLPVEPVDQPPDHRVAGLELLVVGRVDRHLQRRRKVSATWYMSPVRTETSTRSKRSAHFSRT